MRLADLFVFFVHSLFHGVLNIELDGSFLSIDFHQEFDFWFHQIVVQSKSQCLMQSMTEVLNLPACWFGLQPDDASLLVRFLWIT